MGRLLLVLVIAIVVSACGSAPPATPDAGADAGTIAEAEAPVLTPCPAGWREARDASGLAVCEPWPEGGHDGACGAGEAHFVGTPGCARIGTPCAADGWPSDLPLDRPIVYVDDDAIGGDGSTRATAFRSVGDAAVAAPEGAVIAVATGRYDDFVWLGAGQTLWGACAEGTLLSSSASTADHGVIDLGGAGASVRNVGIEASERLGIYAIQGGTIEDVVIVGTRLAGVWADFAATTLRRVAIRDVRTFDGDWGHGVFLGGGATATIEMLSIERVASVGLFVQDGAAAVATDLVIDAAAVRGVYADEGGTVSIARASVRRAGGAALFAGDPGTRIDVTDAVIEDATSDPAGELGRGANVQASASLSLTRVRLLRSREFGVNGSVDATLSLSDVVIADTGATIAGADTAGFSIEQRAAATVARVVVDRSARFGVYAISAGTRLEATDLVVRDTQPDAPTQSAGNGMLVLDGAAVTLARARLERSQQVALAVGGAGTFLEASDLRVLETLPQAGDRRAGRGIELQGGAHVSIDRALVAGSRSAGIFVEASRLQARGVTIEGTRSEESDGRFGAGLWVQDESVVEVSGLRVDGARFVGIGASMGAAITASDVEVSGVAPSECAATTCPEAGGGFGIASHFAARVMASGFAVRDTELCGVVVGANHVVLGPTGLDLAQGVIERSAIGACVQVEGYDTERLRSDVQYRDVGVPLQATSYVLPETIAR